MMQGATPREDQESFPPAGWLALADSPPYAHLIGLRLTLGAAGLVLLIVLLARAAGAAVPVWLVLGLAAVAGMFTLVQERLLDRGRYHPAMPLAHMLVVLILLSIGIAATGAVQSPFVWVYVLSMAVEAILRGAPMALGSATLSAGFLTLSTILVWAHTVPFGGSLWPTRAAAAFLISYVGMFYVVALVMSSLRLQIRRLGRLALIDPLTGLGNRRGVKEHLTREIARAARYHTPVAVIMVDLDGFKQVNDRHGHLHGDQLLRRLAGALQVSRTSDFVGRLGGDEFVLILPQTTPQDASLVGERLRAEIEDASLLLATPVSASIGVACFPRDGTDIQALLEAADCAMYRAKGTGGNCVSTVQQVPVDQQVVPGAAPHGRNTEPAPR